MDTKVMGQSASRLPKETKKLDYSWARNRGWLALIKEQRSRFYIMRKCVVMLLRSDKYDKY
uniref:Uncharacterized protein n=1 Tax=Nelumbo nucifera TaxID=4432 RepID=A0A822ZJ41_NELNU|nr:TPA_asm: hypothetical protein HUJ06_016051 [Nelumbo nucifera]